MTERPILFTGEMVRAILAGRKTMTRRVARRAPAGRVKEPCGHRRWHPADPEAVLACPYGQPGDHLWVRESFRVVNWAPDDNEMCIRYEADGVSRWVKVPEDADPHGDVLNRYWEQGADDMTKAGYGWDEDDEDATAIWRGEGPEPKEMWPFMRLRPSIFMPRWASRITLDITSVRIERLQAITRDDATAEGFERTPAVPIDPRDWFRNLWDGLNAARGYGWDANPWVWVVVFRVTPSDALADLRNAERKAQDGK